MAARILVADDSVTIQKVVELTFSKEDFVLIQARSGEEAIRKAKDERPDLVLLDLVMPDKSGYEVCAALRADPALRAVPIILLIGTFEVFEKEKGIQAGANDFVTKPFDSQSLVGKVKQLLPPRAVEAGAAAAPAGPARVAPPAPAAPASPAPPKEAPRPTPGPAAAPPPRPSPAAAPPGRPAPTAPRPPAPGVAPTPPGPAARPPLKPAAAPPRPSAPAPSPPVPPAMPAAAVPPEKPRPGKPAAEQPAPEKPAPPAPPSSAPGGFGELTLEDLGLLSLPEEPGRVGDRHLEREAQRKVTGPPPQSRGPEPVEPTGGAPPPRAEGLPESLSLEELLSGESETSSLMAEAASGQPEEPSGEPVFDLTNVEEGPPLPLVETGTGEPPAAGTGGIAELELELTPDAEAGQELAAAPAPFDLGGSAEVPATESGEFILEATPEAPWAPEMSAAPPPTAGEPEGLGTDIGTMRQVVTERVAHELARDLGDKLLDRVERIVWEVVPDMAEILISKEIERIRALAEGKQSS